jgi:hypothetical protein
VLEIINLRQDSDLKTGKPGKIIPGSRALIGFSAKEATEEGY